MDPGAGGITPTSQWRPTESWWVGDDARSDDGGPNLPGSQQLAPARNHRRRSQPAGILEADTSDDRTQQPEESVPLADPRCLFGPLPNSSFDGVLDHPIQRVLERREAGVVAAPRSLSNDAGQRSVSFADTAGPRDEDRDCGPTGNSWRNECGRLQIQLASLASEKERWERDRRRLRAEDIDRARDIEGLKRAVEAQSQLVMENLIAAQRLAATGAVPTAGRGRTPNNELPQHAWVPPSAAAPEATDSRWGARGHVNSPGEPPSWDNATSQGDGTVTNHVSDDLHRSAWNDIRYSEGRLSHRGAAIANATATPAQGSATAAAAGEAPPTRDLDSVPFLSYVTSRDPPSTAGFGGSPSPRHPRGATAVGNNGNNNAHSTRDKGRGTPSSIVPGPPPTPTEMVLAPRASALARRYAPQPGATASAHDATCNHDQPQTGWRRVVPRGNAGGRRGVTDSDPADGDKMAAGKSEVWEWNGRRVLVHIARPRQPLVEQGPEGQASTAGQQAEEWGAGERTDISTAATAPAIAEDVRRSRSIVPESLSNDIESIRAMVRALAAGAKGATSVDPETEMERTNLARADYPGLEKGAGAANSGYLPQEPPETARRRRSEPSSYQQMGSTARRRVSSGPLVSEKSNGSSTADRRPGGGDAEAQLASRRRDTSGGSQSDTPESDSKARTDEVPTSGNERAGSGSGGSAGMALPAGGLEDNGGDRGDEGGDDSHGRQTLRREEGQGIDNAYPRELPPPEDEAEGPWGRGRGRGSGLPPSMDENSPPSPTTGKEDGEGEQRQRPPSPGRSCSGSTGDGNPGHADGNVVNAADSESGNEKVPAEDVEGPRR